MLIELPPPDEYEKIINADFSKHHEDGLATRLGVIAATISAVVAIGTIIWLGWALWG